jgi:DNA primase
VLTTPLNTAGQGNETRDLLARVRKEVDLRKIVAEVIDDARDFGHYLRGRCLSPEHKDSNPSALYFADGCHCTACGWRADTVGVYRTLHSELGFREALEELLAGGVYERVAGEEEERKARPAKTLDAELALRFHFALAANQEALTGLEQMGFTRAAIQHFRLGWATVTTRIEGEDGDIFEPQNRYAVPVFNNGRLVQILYRKSDNALGGGKITMESGAGSHLFNADVLHRAELVVFAEGWGDVITLWQAGIPAVTSTNGAGHFREEWAELLGRVKRLYVVGDADAAGLKMVERVQKRLPWARALRLPLLDGSKGDIRDLWLSGWRRREFKQLLRQADFDAAWRVVSKGA